MSLVAQLKPVGPNGFGYRSTVADVTAGLDLAGRTILVTGCRSGLGLATVLGLARRGARIVGTARTAELARAALPSVDGSPGQGGASHLAFACQLADVASVRACAASVVAAGVELDAIVCNAGIMALPKLERAYGYELQFFNNHIGHFLLVTLLLDRLASRGRVVVVSSGAHKRAPRAGIEFDNLTGEKHYAPWTAYGQSKLANLLFAKHLAVRLAGTGKTANALHPGVIRTPLTRHMPFAARLAMRIAEPVFLKTAEQGAATETYLAVHPQVDQISGKYFSDCQPVSPSAHGRDAGLAARLWEESERIVASL